MKTIDNLKDLKKGFEQFCQDLEKDFKDEHNPDDFQPVTADFYAQVLMQDETVKIDFEKLLDNCSGYVCQLPELVQMVIKNRLEQMYGYDSVEVQDAMDSKVVDLAEAGL